MQSETTLAIEKVTILPDSRCWLSPTGRFLATRAVDLKTISFWEARTMSKCGPGLNMEFEVDRVAWSPTEKHIVTCSADEVLRKWSNIFVLPKLVAKSSRKHKDANLEYSPDDRLIASFSIGEAKLWDASNLSLVWEYSGYGYSSVAFHPLGQRVVFLNRSSVVLSVNVEDLGDITTTIRMLDFDVNGVVFEPSGTTCAAWTFDDVKILNADSFKQTTSLPYGNVEVMRFTPDGKYILLVLQPMTFVLWDIAANGVVFALPMDSLGLNVWSICISNDCRVVIVNCFENMSKFVHLLH